MDFQSFVSKNGLKIRESLDYEWDRYGDGNVSVTSVLNLLVDPAFEYVKRNYWDAVKAACERWTAIHQWAEDFFSWRWTTVDKRILKFHVLHDVRVLEQERTYVKESVRWTVDLVASVNGLLTNVDYKSSMKRNEKYRVQLAWYHWLNGNAWWILYLWDGSKFVYDQFDVTEYLPVFLELKDLFFELKNRSWRLTFISDENT